MATPYGKAKKRATPEQAEHAQKMREVQALCEKMADHMADPRTTFRSDIKLMDEHMRNPQLTEDHKRLLHNLKIAAGHAIEAYDSGDIAKAIDMAMYFQKCKDVVRLTHFPGAGKLYLQSEPMVFRGVWVRTSREQETVLLRLLREADEVDVADAKRETGATSGDVLKRVVSYARAAVDAAAPGRFTITKRGETISITDRDSTSKK